VAFDSAGNLVGGSDFKAQAEQVFANLGRALASVGASLADVVKSTTFITDAKHVPALRGPQPPFGSQTSAGKHTVGCVSPCPARAADRDRSDCGTAESLAVNSPTSR
jgi:enamine deaminase RidA (YjgF/YER057c/UK114 family)